MAFPAIILGSISIGPFSWYNDQRNDFCTIANNQVVQQGLSSVSAALHDFFCVGNPSSGNIQDIASRVCTTSGTMLFPTLCPGYKYAQEAGFTLMAGTLLNALGIASANYLLYCYTYGKVMKAKYRVYAQIFFVLALVVFVGGAVTYQVTVLQHLNQDCPVLGASPIGVATSFVLKTQGEGNFGYGAYMLCMAVLLQLVMGGLLIMVASSKEMSQEEIDDMKADAETSAILDSFASGAGVGSYGVAGAAAPVQVAATPGAMAAAW